LPLGYGRRIAGRAGTNVGFDFFALRTSGAMWFAHGTSLAKSGGRHQLVCTQTHQRLEGEERQIHRAGTLEEFRANPDFVRAHVENPPREETLYEPDQFDYERKWGMAIDLTTCIGCNACLMACNIENNIPVVGRQQVAMSREMLWLRLDTYFEGELENPRIHFQPVPCMHCGNAPCEYVCPVEAAIHDHEGLNLQVYNRCVGTRYCSNNCPYKVRRFNFLHYAHPGPLEALGQNPEVTVRARGVMEKCTYCVQRISAARIEAKKENRPIRDGEVRTACQEACPANAIVFGIMTDRNSAVAKYKEHPLDFSMLGQLNTRPRTTYLAQLSNPNAALRPPTESRGKNEEREV
jgi:molybdopterin-containing oxidoreductase family iron-sulfur binding subunit